MGSGISKDTARDSRRLSLLCRRLLDRRRLAGFVLRGPWLFWAAERVPRPVDLIADDHHERHGDDRGQVAIHYYNNLGCQLRNRGEFRQAVTELHRALECAGPNDDTTAVYHNLATVHARLHNVEEARPYMELVAEAWGLSDGWPDSHWFASMPAAVMEEIRERYGAG